MPKASPNPFAELPTATSQPVRTVPWTSPAGTPIQAVSEADESMIVDSAAVSSRFTARPATVLQRTIKSVLPMQVPPTVRRATPEIRIIPRRRTYRPQPKELRYGADEHSTRNAVLNEVVQVAGEDGVANSKSPFAEGGRMQWRSVSQRREFPAKRDAASWQPQSGSHPPVELPAPLPKSNARSIAEAATAGLTGSPAVQVKDLDFGREPAVLETQSRIPLLLVLSLVAVLAVVVVRHRRKRFSRI